MTDFLYFDDTSIIRPASRIREFKASGLKLSFGGFSQSLDFGSLSVCMPSGMVKPISQLVVRQIFDRLLSKVADSFIVM